MSAQVITRRMVDASHNNRMKFSGKAIRFQLEPLGFKAWIIKFQEINGSFQVGGYSTVTLIIRTVFTNMVVIWNCNKSLLNLDVSHDTLNTKMSTFICRFDALNFIDFVYHRSHMSQAKFWK